MPLSAGAPSNTSRRHGRCSHQDFTITKYVDTASPVPQSLLQRGNTLKKAVITIYQASEEDSKSAPVAFFTYDWTDVIIGSVSVGAGGGDLPIETLSLNYTAIKWAYKQQKQDSPGTASGDVSASWDLEKNA